MSAFLCSELHTAVLAQFAHAQGLADSPRAAAVALRSVNNQALKQRYGDKPTRLDHMGGMYMAALRYMKQFTSPDAAYQAIAALSQCFVYQCSEGTAMSSKGGRLLERINTKAFELSKGHVNPAVWSI